MAEQAMSRGLKINSQVDERTNFRKSTHAAAKILRDLYTEFNDWPLAIAAYNCGDGRVRQAIRRSGSKNFWRMYAYLPPETRGHVKRFIATHYIFEGSGGVTTSTASEIKHYNLKVVAATRIIELQARNNGCDTVKP
jgi:membrane-bound lytic murein transglycosylase D